MSMIIHRADKPLKNGGKSRYLIIKKLHAFVYEATGVLFNILLVLWQLTAGSTWGQVPG